MAVMCDPDKVTTADETPAGGESDETKGRGQGGNAETASLGHVKSPRMLRGKVSKN